MSRIPINTALSAAAPFGFPDPWTHVPGVTIDRQCGSSQQAVHFAAQAVMSGTQDRYGIPFNDGLDHVGAQVPRVRIG